MATKPCYSGPNPITEDERLAIWKWAKEFGGIDKGKPIEFVGDEINKKFFNDKAPPEWISDIISGRKTPLRQVTNDMWRRQYNRRVIQQQARENVELLNITPFGKWMRRLWYLPRTAAVFGHGVVFPVTHAGDLVFRPASWGVFIKGALRTYRASPELWGLGSRFGGGKAYAGRMLNAMTRDALYDTALRSGLDVGSASHPSGLISRTYHGPAARAWDMLTVMRYELWKKQMGKFIKDGMDEATVNEIGTQLAEWANNATGAGKGPISQIGGGKFGLLFGPKLTQSKLNRLVADPIQTVNTFQKMIRGIETTPGERAAAWTRLSGAVQYAITNLGFLAVNQGVLAAFGSKDRINWWNPFKGDFWAFKAPGVHGFMPGLHSEVRTLAQILATAFMSRRELRGESRQRMAEKVIGGYARGKLAPTYQRGLEFLYRQDFMGRPLPFSTEPGTEKLPKVTPGEYAADIGPIPLSGPIGFFYDHLKQSGASSLDAMAITKGLIIFGIGLPGIHVRAEPPAKEATAVIPQTGSVAQRIRAMQKAQGITPLPRSKSVKQRIKDLQKQGP